MVKLMSDEMKQRVIATASECTLRGFTCSIANVDPKTATPAEIAKICTDALATRARAAICVY
jgi:hypothetical protein